MNGDLKSESTHILIYATYLAENKKNIINYHLNIFNSIFDEVVLINNSDDFKTAHKLTKDLKASVIINRYNSGRDIGAYKEGYSYIYNKIDSLASLKKITFINDSIIIVDRNLLDLFSKIELFGCSYHGSTYALSPYFHGQSFLFSFSINLFKRHEINEFFKYYRLVNSRHNAVYKGELGLFKAIQSTNCETIFNYDPLNIFTLKDNEYSSFIEKIPLNIRNYSAPFI
ncbi:hypothetical protein [Endozoicomonas sp.]|uniref:hypothetical protein n=1 Tax=Endozoicomonas sp. TaxID=1892382 RepID=UPI003AF4D2E1